MTKCSGGPGFFSSVQLVSQKSLAVSLALLIAAVSCVAQDSPPSRPDSNPGSQASPQVQTPQDQAQQDQTRQDRTQQGETQNRATDGPPITIPAGTHLAMALTHPVDSKTIHRGDEIFAQTTSPVIVSNQVVIPAGTFVQGKVDKLARRGSRGELLMRSVSVVFPNGYVASIGGPAKMESDEGTAWNNPSSATKAGIIAAPLAGLGIGAAIGASQHTTQSSTLGGTTISSSTPKGLAIGSIVGLAAGGAVSLILLARSHHFYVQEGSPLEMSLPQPVTLAQAQTTSPESGAAPVATLPKRPPASPMPASANHGTCYVPGRPGTPATYIPGTPAVGNSSGTPGTYFPGMPPTPPITYPCP
ncbi:MAG: hypothetical protein JWN74_3809 [Acidobacteriaceae bacterium]|nr:hypothetical protein [Acidobacteriaceae bacterium]